MEWNGPHLADNNSKYNFFDENVCILIQMAPKLVPESPIDNRDISKRYTYSYSYS